MLALNTDRLEDLSSFLRRKQAQAMLELFQADCGRAAVALNEVKEWASAQQDNELRSRMGRLISGHMRTDGNQDATDRIDLRKQPRTNASAVSKALTSLLVGWI